MGLILVFLTIVISLIIALFCLAIYIMILNDKHNKKIEEQQNKLLNRNLKTKDK